MKRLEALLEWGGTKKEIALLALSGAALLLSIAGVRPAGIDPAWAAIVLCGIPILLEAFIGLVTAFDIKADVLVSLALVASVVISTTEFAVCAAIWLTVSSPLLEPVVSAVVCWVVVTFVLLSEEPTVLFIMVWLEEGT